jgi:hypothetical protein
MHILVPVFLNRVYTPSFGSCVITTYIAFSRRFACTDLPGNYRIDKMQLQEGDKRLFGSVSRRHKSTHSES